MQAARPPGWTGAQPTPQPRPGAAAAPPGAAQTPRRVAPIVYDAGVSRRELWAVGVLFLVSGASSLGFEVIWAQQLARVLGGTTTAVAFVVALFMGGLALGAAAGGRLAAKLARPIMVYGLAEIAVAALAVASVHLIPGLESSLPRPLVLAATVAALLPCTILIGTTLPLLVDATRGSLGGSVGGLYALNTGGAVLGVLATGMFLIGELGLRGSASVLGVVGVGVGLAACIVGRRPRIIPADAPTSAPPRAARAGAPSELDRSWVLCASLVGFASLAEEVLWTRALVAHLNSSTYALAAILAVFLAGLALGAAASGSLMRRGVAPLPLLVTTQVTAGVFVLYSPESLWVAESAVSGYVGIRLVGGLAAWWQTVWVSLGRTAFALLAPTWLLGFALPLLCELYARSTHRRGEAVGALTAANTLGAVLGSLCARFALLPVLGVGGGLRAMTLVHAGVALLTAWRGRASWAWRALPAALLVTAVLRAQPVPFLGRLAAGHEVIFFDEGVQDTTVVVEVAGGGRQILSNGIAYAGDSDVARRYMRLLGHLPSLLARNQRRALVVCLGTGMTAAAVARHEAFERLDLVDISPVVHQTLPLFAHVNDRVFHDPRAHIHFEDGRVFMAHSADASYDVITLEPPPPRVAGVAGLYSVEFYRRAKELLAEGGAIAQWLPIHGMTEPELRMLARTFVAVFPNAAFVELHPREGGLIATRGEGAGSKVIAERLAAAPVREHLQPLGVNTLESLRTIRGDALRRALGPGPVVTDDHPRIEHFAANLGHEARDTERDAETFMTSLLGP